MAMVTIEHRTLIGNPIVSLLLLCINSDIICPGDHVSIVLYYDTACICSTWRMWGWVYAWVCMNDVLSIWEACDVFYLRNAGYASVMFAISRCPSLCITSRIVSKWLDGSCCVWHLRPILHSVISKIPVSPQQLKQGFCFLEPCLKWKCLQRMLVITMCRQPSLTKLELNVISWWLLSSE